MGTWKCPCKWELYENKSQMLPCHHFHTQERHCWLQSPDAGVWRKLVQRPQPRSGGGTETGFCPDPHPRFSLLKPSCREMWPTSPSIVSPDLTLPPKDPESGRNSVWARMRQQTHNLSSFQNRPKAPRLTFRALYPALPQDVPGTHGMAVTPACGGLGAGGSVQGAGEK